MPCESSRLRLKSVSLSIQRQFAWHQRIEAFDFVFVDPHVLERHMDLSIVVISHGHESYLSPCLNSLKEAVNGISAEILVLDNLGRSVSNVLADATHSPLRILNNSTPQGFARNVNVAAEEARGKFLLVLNPDTTHTSGQIRDLTQFLDSAPSVGIVACKLLNPDGTVQQSYRRFPTIPVAVSRMLRVDSWPWRPSFYRYRLMEHEQLDHPAPVDWVFGAFMLVRRQQFQDLGGMDASFRLYYEDVDLCYRYRLAGFETYYFPTVAFMHHHLRTSASNAFSATRRWHASSMIRFFAKHRYAFKPHIKSFVRGAR
jgi:GT2 family glycosyltransferase